MMTPINRTLAPRTHWGMTHRFEHDRISEASWYEVAFSYGLKIAAGITVLAAGAAVGLVIYYAV